MLRHDMEATVLEANFVTPLVQGYSDERRSKVNTMYTSEVYTSNSKVEIAQ